MRFGKSVIDIGSESLERNAAFFSPLGSGNFSTAQATSHHDFYSHSTGSHAALDCLLHCPTESNPLFQLLGNRFGNQLAFEIDAVDLQYIDANINTGAVQ